MIPVHPAVGPTLQASKWQHSQILIDSDEMQGLMNSLADFSIVRISGLIQKGNEIITREMFLEVYKHYISTLKQGDLPSDSRLRPFFSSVFTCTLDALYTVPVNTNHCLVKVLRPVIQLQAHRFDYSTADGKFRSMVLGQESIQWGLQFSYPHLYQDENYQVYTVREEPQFPNTALFKKLQQWVRANTIATPFEVEGKRVNVPIRLGKQCFSWINDHPQLAAKGLRCIPGLPVRRIS